MQPTPQDIQLRSKHKVLSFKPQLRLEWQRQDGQHETEQPDHSASLCDSITSSTRIRFSVHTGTKITVISGTSITFSNNVTGTLTASGIRFSPILDAQTMSATDGSLTHTITLGETPTGITSPMTITLAGANQLVQAVGPTTGLSY